MARWDIQEGFFYQGTNSHPTTQRVTWIIWIQQSYESISLYIQTQFLPKAIQVLDRVASVVVFILFLGQPPRAKLKLRFGNTLLVFTRACAYC